MSLKEWDRTAVQLRAIEEHAAWVAHHCEHQIAPHIKKMRLAMDRLEAAPEWPFPTKAEGEMSEAIDRLHTQLCLIKTLLEHYRAKPKLVEKQREFA